MEAAGHPAIARIHSFGADGDGSAAYFDTAVPPVFSSRRSSRQQLCHRSTSPTNPAGRMIARPGLKRRSE
jgi:hypothetical protein